MGRTAIVCYRAQRDAEESLHALCASHYAKLYVLGFVTRKLPVFLCARDGCVMQVLEWKSQLAIEAAGQHPAVLDLRRAYAEVSELVPLAALPEAAQALALFEPAPFTVELPPFHKVYNHVQVDERISTSGVISGETIEQMAREGYGALINLLPDTHQHALSREAELAGQHALAYHHIPVDFAAPTSASYSAFEQALDGVAQNQRVYVHCAANMRVSAFLAIYGTKRFGWTSERAEQLIAEVWQPNDIWRKFLDAQLTAAS
jgi:protein tyrosine phosphatase (PTP) superfamily phosphohydrolase (DUF442 family)